MIIVAKKSKKLKNITFTLCEGKLKKFLIVPLIKINKEINLDKLS